MKVKDKQIKEIQALATEVTASIESEVGFLKRLVNSGTSKISTIYRVHEIILENKRGRLHAYRKVIKILEINEQIH